ncbi:hypothetical protein PvtlMGM2_1486 [Prevotella sp. MGM2]|nr:hypothetical protein PvtlMGM2_1486 [Prevotella sp. MGM2]
MFLVKQFLDAGRAFVMPLPISFGLNAEMRFEDVPAHFEPDLTVEKNDEREDTEHNGQYGIENFD